MKKPLRLLIALVLFLQAMTCIAGDPPVVFYTQLIRGTDQDKPAGTAWRRIGPKLAHQLSPKFRWTNYWEVSHHSTTVEPGHSSRFRLTSDREVEIELSLQNHSVIRLYINGVLTRCSRQPAHTPMTIMGGARENDESWFVVIRRDRPSNSAQANVAP